MMRLIRQLATRRLKTPFSVARWSSTSGETKPKYHLDSFDEASLTLTARPKTSEQYETVIDDPPAPISKTVIAESRFLFERGVPNVLILNDPKTLNALDSNNVSLLLQYIKKYEKENIAQLHFVRGSGEKSFCSGTNYRWLHGLVDSGDREAVTDYQVHLHRLCYGFYGLGQAVMPFMDGLTNSLGLVPHGGVTKTLANSRHCVGTYMALTGAPLKAYNVMHAGLATHYLASDMIPALRDYLGELKTTGNRLERALLAVGACAGDPEPYVLAKHLDAMRRHFGEHQGSVGDIITSLEKDSSAFAQRALRRIKTKSPLAMEVTLSLLRAAKDSPIEDCIRRDYAVMCRLLRHGDFKEGVSYNLLKMSATSHPHWSTAGPDRVDAILNGNGNDDFEELMLDDIERDKQEPLELLDIPWMVDGLEGNLDGDLWNAVMPYTEDARVPDRDGVYHVSSYLDMAGFDKNEEIEAFVREAVGDDKYEADLRAARLLHQSDSTVWRKGLSPRKMALMRKAQLRELKGEVTQLDDSAFHAMNDQDAGNEDDRPKKQEDDDDDDDDDWRNSFEVGGVSGAFEQKLDKWDVPM